MSDGNLKAAVVGTGHLGRHHTRILSQMEGIDFIGAYDADPDQLAAITAEHGVAALESAESAGDADLVVVATPTVNHRDTAGPISSGSTPVSSIGNRSRIHGDALTSRDCSTATIRWPPRLSQALNAEA